MSLRFLYSILLFVSISCQAQEKIITADFLTGVWQPVVSDDIDFDVWFYVEDGYISGQYCAMTSNASRIDCKEAEDDELDCGIKHPFTPDQSSLEIDVVSCHSLKKGRVGVTRQDDKLVWELLEAEGRYMYDHLLPQRTVLTKIADDPFE